MEDWKMWVFWAAVGLNLVVGVWNLVVTIRHERKAAYLDRETYEKRPLLSEDKVAAMRPGDTALVMPSLDGMTLDQQTRLIDSIRRMADRAKELGIEFMVIPDWGQKAIVVARSALSEHARYGCHDADHGSSNTKGCK